MRDENNNENTNENDNTSHDTSHDTTIISNVTGIDYSFKRNDNKNISNLTNMTVHSTAYGKQTGNNNNNNEIDNQSSHSSGSKMVAVVGLNAVNGIVENMNLLQYWYR